MEGDIKSKILTYIYQPYFLQSSTLFMDIKFLLELSFYQNVLRLKYKALYPAVHLLMNKIMHELV